MDAVGAFDEVDVYERHVAGPGRGREIKRSLLRTFLSDRLSIRRCSATWSRINVVLLYLRCQD